MATQESMACCGVREIDGLYEDPKGVLLDLFANSYYDDDTGASLLVLGMTQHGRKVPFLIFTDNHHKCDIPLTQYINDHNLGTVLTTLTKKNPNSRNNIRVNVWTVNYRRLEAHLNKIIKKENKKAIAEAKEFKKNNKDLSEKDPNEYSYAERMAEGIW